MLNSEQIFTVTNETFFKAALSIYDYQLQHNQIYKEYHKQLNINQYPKNIESIPFLPIEFFKTKKVVSGEFETKMVFESSGTTGQTNSKHYIKSTSLYETSFLNGFKSFFGDPKKYCIIGLLPSYLERQNSSLVYMVNKLIEISGHSDSGFYLDDLDTLSKLLKQLNDKQVPTILFGVTFALLDLAEQFPQNLQHIKIVETGGMKGKRKEIIRAELHQILKKAFNLNHVYSEYGMTELLSQAYMLDDGKFHCPPWMKILIRDPYDPYSILKPGQAGAINVIDLANIHSSSFIATNDLGKLNTDGTFEVLGRLQDSEIRGCNLMVS